MTGAVLGLDGVSAVAVAPPAGVTGGVGFALLLGVSGLDRLVFLLVGVEGAIVICTLRARSIK